MFPVERLAIVERSFKSDSDRPPKKGRSCVFAFHSPLFPFSLEINLAENFTNHLITSTSFQRNPDVAACIPRKRLHRVEPVCLTARLSAIAHLAAAAATTSTAMMMHEFYGRGAA